MEQARTVSVCVCVCECLVMILDLDFFAIFISPLLSDGRRVTFPSAFFSARHGHAERKVFSPVPRENIDPSSEKKSRITLERKFPPLSFFLSPKKKKYELWMELS